MAKVYDLAFYKGIGNYPSQIYQSDFDNMIGSAETSIVYPYQGFDIANQYYSIDTTDSYQLFFSEKILNNNVVFNDFAYITPFLGVRYKIESSSLSLILSLPVTNIAGQNIFTQITYDEVVLDTGLPDGTGNIGPAINALRLRIDREPDNSYYGAFPCVIFTADLATPDIAYNIAYLTNLQETENVLIDFDRSNPGTALGFLYYFITRTAAYGTLAGFTVPQAIPIPQNFVNLQSIAAYRGANVSLLDTVLIGGFDSDANEYRCALIDVATGNLVKYTTVGNGGEYPINRIYWVREENGEPSYYAIATANGAFVIEEDTLDTRETVTNSDDKNVTDIWSHYSASGGGGWIWNYATTAGFFRANNVVPNFTAYETSKSFNCIASVIQTFNSVYAGGNGYLYYRPDNQDAVLANNSNFVWNDVVAGFLGGTFQIAIGATQSRGVFELRPLNGDENSKNRILEPPLFFDYVITFADLIKEDVYIYYGLLEITGCGEADGGANLFKLDYDNEIYEVGKFEGNITTNKLWIADNFFILNNTQDLNSLYYKSLLNLDLSELTGDQQELVGEDAGIFNTTEAGDVVDIIIDRSMFYILGTRAIEVWQNNGASGFPYRKQPYVTAKYHNFPKGISSSTNQISRFTSYGLGYVIVTLDNTENRIEIVAMKDGSAKPMPYNRHAWLQIVNTYLGGNVIDDIQINNFELYEEDYIAITFLDNSIIPLGTALINSKGDIFFINDGTTFYQYIPTVGEGSTFVLFNENDITARFYEYLPAVLPNPVGFNYKATSQLLRPKSSQLGVNQLIIQYAYPYDNSNAIPVGSQYEVNISTDGRPGSQLVFQKDFLNDERQIVVQINRQMPSFVFTLKTNIPIIILGAYLIYNEGGLK